MNLAIWYALASCGCFSLASVVFAHYSKNISALWMNAFKAILALLAFGVAMVFTKDFSISPGLMAVSLFFLSGLLGLNIGDNFLLKAFATMGAARTLMIFSFQPIFVGIMSYFFLSQGLTWYKAIAIIFMMGCVFTLSYERFYETKKWDFRGPIYALIGVSLDSVGIVLTRAAFENDPHISIVEGNFYRCLGAVVGFGLMAKFIPLHLWGNFRKVSFRGKYLVIGASLLGTFVSLWFYLTALSFGHLATVTAIAGTSPLFSAIFESLYTKKWPSRFLIFSFLLFAMGFYFIAS